MQRKKPLRWLKVVQEVKSLQELLKFQVRHPILRVGQWSTTPKAKTEVLGVDEAVIARMECECSSC